MDIRILPSNIANMIAAGEVVQRPSSVVKELLENAVDAGADQVTVIIKDAGRTLVQVIDNGCGMSPDEAVLCFERHATSKISSAEDLQHIQTYGFRGEALASIAAVAEVTLKTRREEDQVGCQVDYADSKHLSTIEVSAPKGSSFSVRNIFYNVPARRKFLKSDNVEFKHILEEFTRVALTRPEIGFTLVHNGRDIHVLRKAKSLKFRIQDLLGRNTADKVVELHADTSVVNLSGYICRPDEAKKTVSQQFFFVNGRYFRSPYMHKAVMKAYEDMIADGATPSYFIYMDIDPNSIDVNISPTKTEIKFEDDSVVFQILYAAVRESLGKNSFSNGLDFDLGGAPDLPTFGQNYDNYRPDVVAPQTSFDPGYNPFDTPSSKPAGGYSSKGPVFDGFSGGEPDFGPAPSPYGQAPVKEYPDFSSMHRKETEDYSRLFEDRTLPSTDVVILQGKYIVTPVKSGLMLVNIRRAWERILYERFLEAFSKNAPVTRVTMFPVEIVVGPENRLVFEEHLDYLQGLGFDIAPKDMDKIVVNGIPEGFSCDDKSVEALMADVLIAITETGTATLAGMMESSMAEKFAKMGSARGEKITSAQQARKLIDTLFGCSNAEFTSSGLKVLSIIPLGEIDSKF
ncbi:MAG: DNA mismatch repair endonuclease MutL [Bacteroidales bacterium]|nr:DNA mismatch repair endonuclease MutL [Bacteroidales bacterium]